MAKQKKNYLSKHWVETVDPTTGKTYYANTKTKETTWQRPVDKIKQDIKENGPYVPKSSAQKPKNAPKDVWVERQDPETGKVFFYNPVSKQTSWHRPDKVLSHDVHTVQQGKGLWEERVDPRTGRPFFYNPVLKVTSWVNPDEETAEEEKKDNNGVIKRLSMNVARLSMGLSRRSGLGGGFPMGKGNRNSASFTMDNPAMPVAHNTARQSLRLGADDISNDMFENLRKMQNLKPTSVRLSTTNNERAKEDFLNINLQDEMDTVDLSSEMLDFKTYAAENFKLTKKKMFGTKSLNVDVVSSYQKTQIKQGLHLFHDKFLAADALLSFKFLLMYMGCKKKGKGEAITAQDFVKMGIQTKISFQGELYAQLIKQSTRNPYEDQVEAVFELFALCCGSFPPPEDLEPYVKSHLRSQVETSQSQRIKQLALYALLRMSRYKERLYFPSLQEIAAVRSIDTVELTIELISADAVTMQVDSWTTVKDVKERIQARFDIVDGEPFSLFEISNGDQDRHLADTDMILDVIGLWEDTGGDFQCFYKMRLYFDINEEDTAAVELAYLQTVFEVIDQRYPCEEIDAIRLAALEAQEKFGDFDGTDVFGDQLAAYIPHRFYSPETAEEIKKDIYAEYQRMQGTDKLQCMINYMAYVKKWKFYGCAYFFAEPLLLKVLAKEFPKTVLIAINAKGVMIVDPTTKDVIVEYPYSEIVTWGHSEANFVLVVGNLVRSTKLFFSSIDGKDMNQLIHAYVHKLMEAQTEEERDEVLKQHFGEEA